MSCNFFSRSCFPGRDRRTWSEELGLRGGGFQEHAVAPVAVGDGLPAGGVVGDGGSVALRGEVDVAARPWVVEAVHAAAVMLEQIADGVVGVVLRGGDEQCPFGEAGGEAAQGRHAQGGE